MVPLICSAVGITVYTIGMTRKNEKWKNAGTVFMRVGQLVGGLLRVFAEQIDKTALKAGNVVLGSFNISDAVAGIVSTLASNTKTKNIAGVVDIVMAGILAFLSKSISLTLTRQL